VLLKPSARMKLRNTPTRCEFGSGGGAELTVKTMNGGAGTHGACARRSPAQSALNDTRAHTWDKLFVPMVVRRVQRDNVSVVQRLAIIAYCVHLGLAVCGPAAYSDAWDAAHEPRQAATSHPQSATLSALVGRTGTPPRPTPCTKATGAVTGPS
jgi:hypothetical protein